MQRGLVIYAIPRASRTVIPHLITYSRGWATMPKYPHNHAQVSSQSMQPRLVIADLIRNPEVKGGAYNKTNQPPSPSPLMAEDQSLSQCLTLGAEGENDVPHRPNPANPRQHRPVMLDLIQNPQGREHRVTARPAPSFWT